MAGIFEHGYALLIAVNENKVDRLALPVVAQDVAALQRVLTHPKRCAYLPDNVKVITGKQSTHQGIREGLMWLAEHIQADASGNATAVIYYSGHGWRNENIQPPGHYLIPFDVREGQVPLSALRAEDFAGLVGAVNAKRLLVVLDCCHAGGMDVKGVKSLIPDYKEAAVPPQLLMGAEKIVPLDDKGKGLEVLSRSAGRAVLSSSQGTQRSYIRQDGLMSIFTYHLIEALIGHAQPQEGASEVLVSDVMGYVWRNVPESARRDWGQEQQPDYQVSGNFPLALLLGGKGLSKGQPAPDPLESMPGREKGEKRAEVHVGKISNVSGGQINIAGGDIVSTYTERQVDMGGGVYIEKPVDTRGGDFAGGNKVVQENKVNGNGGQKSGDKVTADGITDIERLFRPLVDLVAHAPQDVRERAKQIVEELQNEITKGESADDSRIAKLLDELVESVPDVVNTVVSIFASLSLAGTIGPVTLFVLERMRAK